MQAALPNIEIKNKVWSEIISTSKDFSKAQLEAKLESFNKFDQKELMEPFIGKFFLVIPELAKTSSFPFFKSFFK